MTTALRILIVDDHPIVRAGLRQTLAGAPEVGEVVEAADAPQALELVHREEWDAVVLDIGLPGRGGLDLLKDIKATRPKLPVLILTMHSEDQFGIRAIRAGASGFLTKEAAGEHLINAIRIVASGGRYIGPVLADKLVTEVRAGGQALHAALSDREFEVLCLLASAMTVGEIAERFSLSVKTVSTYRSRILEKMNLKNNAEIMHYAISNGLLDPQHPSDKPRHDK